VAYFEAKPVAFRVAAPCLVVRYHPHPEISHISM